MSAPVVFVTLTDMTTVIGPTSFKTFLSSKSSILTTSIVTSIPPLPSGWPTPAPSALPKDAPTKLTYRNDAVAIITLVILVLLCFIFVLFLAYYVFQKWKGNCSNCKSLQNIIDKYASGELVSITKQTCIDRENLFQEEAKKANKRNNNSTTWSLNFKAGPKYKPSVGGEQAAAPPVLAHQAQASSQDATTRAGHRTPSISSFKSKGSGQNHSTGSYNRHVQERSLMTLEGKNPETLDREKSYKQNRAAFADRFNLRDGVEEEIPFKREQLESKVLPSSLNHRALDDNREIHNPYVMNGIPTGDAVPPRTLATYRAHNEDAQRKDKEVWPDPSEAYMKGQTKQQRRTGAYGRFTPLTSPRDGFQNIDLEGQTKEKKPIRKGWFN